MPANDARSAVLGDADLLSQVFAFVGDLRERCAIERAALRRLGVLVHLAAAASTSIPPAAAASPPPAGLEPADLLPVTWWINKATLPPRRQRTLPLVCRLWRDAATSAQLLRDVDVRLREARFPAVRSLLRWLLRRLAGQPVERLALCLTADAYGAYGALHLDIFGEGEEEDEFSEEPCGDLLWAVVGAAARGASTLTASCPLALASPSWRRWCRPPACAACTWRRSKATRKPGASRCKWLAWRR